MLWIIARQRRPNISATEPATSGPTPSHRKSRRAGGGLQEAPGQVLHRHRQGEVGDSDGDVAGERLHHEAEALAHAHAEAGHDRRAEQDRQVRLQVLGEAHLGAPFITQVCVHYGD